MFKVEKGSIEEALLNLQSMGLQINEYKKSSDTISISLYEELLEFTISNLRKVDSYQKEINELFDQVNVR